MNGAGKLQYKPSTKPTHTEEVQVGGAGGKAKTTITSMRSNEMQDFRTRHGSHLDTSQLLQALYLHALDLVQLGANCVVDQFQMHGNGSAL